MTERKPGSLVDQIQSPGERTMPVEQPRGPGDGIDPAGEELRPPAHSHWRRGPEPDHGV